MLYIFIAFHVHINNLRTRIMLSLQTVEGIMSVVNAINRIIITIQMTSNVKTLLSPNGG